MKIGSWLAGAFLAVMCVSTAQAATITIVASADGTVSDFNEDGTFDNVNTASGNIPVTNGKVNQPAMGVFEFDLSALPADAVITGAQFLFRVVGAARNEDGFNLLQLAGAPGDGQVTLADANAIAVLLGTLALPFPGEGPQSIAVSPALGDLAAVSPLVMLRLQSAANSNAIAHSIESLETDSRNGIRPSLLIEYETPTPPAVPEPGTMLLLGTGILPLLRRLRGKKPVAAAFGGALLLTLAGGQAWAQESAADALAAQADRIAHKGLTFAPCKENPSLECGTLTVPVDYGKPYGEQVGVAVIRARATNPAKRIGVVVGNPGGPGISGVDFVLGGINVPAFARLRERFDVVSFDPRGVGRTRPVRCVADFPDPPVGGDDADDATLAAYFDEVGKAFAKACLEQNGPWVTKLGTNNVARDIDMLRRALGEKQITYAAGSYGSELGATYVSLFPERVRAVLLDGTVTPVHRDYFVEFLSEFSTAFEHAFRRLDQLCRRDAACRLADSGVVSTFDDLSSRLKAAPVTSPQGVVVTDDVLANIVSVLLDRESTWPLIVTALANAQAGDFGLLFQLAPLVASGDDGGVFFAISCNDYGTRRPAADYLRVDEANGAMNPRFFGRFFLADYVAMCSAWPQADPPVIRELRHRVHTPILIIGNDFDSRTPLSAARRLADVLGMDRSLVRYTGGGHTAFAKTTACIQETIEAYLFDLRLPAEGFACEGRTISFGPPPSSSLRQTSGASPTEVIAPDFWPMWSVPRPLSH